MWEILSLGCILTANRWAQDSLINVKGIWGSEQPASFLYSDRAARRRPMCCHPQKEQPAWIWAAKSLCTVRISSEAAFCWGLPVYFIEDFCLCVFKARWPRLWFIDLGLVTEPLLSLAAPQKARRGTVPPELFLGEGSRPVTNSRSWFENWVLCTWMRLCSLLILSCGTWRPWSAVYEEGSRLQGSWATFSSTFPLFLSSGTSAKHRVLVVGWLWC